MRFSQPVSLWLVEDSSFICLDSEELGVPGAGKPDFQLAAPLSGKSNVKDGALTEPARIARQSIRYPVWLTASCRTSLGSASDVILSNLSADGCGLTAADGLLRPGQQVVIRLQSIEGLPGKVCWVRGKRAGVKFDRPLYGPVVEHLVKVQLTAAAPAKPPSNSGTRRV